MNPNPHTAVTKSVQNNSTNVTEVIGGRESPEMASASSQVPTVSTPGAAPPSVVQVSTMEPSPRQINLSHLHHNENKFEAGYDSDNEQGPFFDANVDEGEQDFEEDELTPSNETVQASNDDAPVHVPIEESVLATLKVQDLKEELQKRGKKKGISNMPKNKLLEVLKDLLAKKVPVGIKDTEEQQGTTTPKAETLKEFCEGAYWKVLTAEVEAVVEPDNPNFQKPYAPTVNKEEAEYVPVKHNFSEEFDRPPFTATLKSLFSFEMEDLKKTQMERL